MAERHVTLVREGRKLLQEEQKIRLAAVLVVLLYAVAGHPETVALVYLAAALMISSLLVSRYSSSVVRSLAVGQFQLSAMALVLLDLVAVTLLIAGGGGAQSGFFVLYLVSLVFAAAFFRGLELALLTLLAAVLYTGVSWVDLGSIQSTWHLSARLFGLVLVAWYAYALSAVLHREKDANDQLLRHLTEGVVVFDRTEKVTLVNATMLDMIGASEEDFVGRTCAELAGRNPVLSWLVGAVGQSHSGFKTRVGCFPDADLPLVECTTIPCGVDEEGGGWLVVCKDLRDLKGDTRSARRQIADKLAPLSDLRALSEALYGMAGYLDDRKRWHAIEVIERHTVALQSLLADMLHRDDAHEPALDLGFVDIASLLSSTRRLLEIQPGDNDLAIEASIEQGLPEVNADRARLGQCLLELCRALMSVGKDTDKLVMDVRSGDNTVVFALELVSRQGQDIPPTPLSEAEQAAYGALAELPIFQVIEEHHGRWECLPDCSHFRRVVFELPIAGPAYAGEEPTEEAAAAGERPRSLAAPPLEPALAAEVTNQLKNTLNVIRGYAEMALQDARPEHMREVVQRSIELSDQASELVDALQPATGEFDLHAKASGGTAEALEPEPEVAAPAWGVGMERHVLVVDDDAAMRGMLVTVLRSAGYVAVEASDGKTAVERIRRNPPALAFVDMSMPRVTGVEVLREAKRHAPGLPVVLMTGYAARVANQALGEEKPYAILSKPFGVDEVLSLVKAVMGAQAQS